MTRDPGSADVSQERRYEGLSPRHQFQLVSSLDLPRRVAVDWFLRYVSRLPAGPVPAYATSNVRVSWQPHQQIEVAISGQNLHAARHLEWASGAAGGVRIERTVQIGVTWRR